MKLQLTVIEEVVTNHIIDTEDYEFSEKEEERVLQVAEFINEIKSDPRPFLDELGHQNVKHIIETKSVEITNA